jgi:hypothetical protein
MTMTSNTQADTESMTPAEYTALRRDAEQRLAVLLKRQQRLMPDQDDPETLSELVMVRLQIVACQKVLR